MYFKVAIVNGIIDIDYKYMARAAIISETEALVELNGGFTSREGWEVISEEMFLTAIEPAPAPEQ